MGRPRRAADDELLAGTARAISRVGPARLTLAHVAEETGHSPAALVQRFGSKRGLLVAFAERAAAGVPAAFEHARRRHPSALETLLDDPSGAADHVGAPEAFANHLALLLLDLADPELRVHARAHAAAVRRGLQALLDEAVAAGDLERCDTARLARALQATTNGALLTWALCGRGTLARWLRDEVELLLEPYRAPRVAAAPPGP